MRYLILVRIAHTKNIGNNLYWWDVVKQELSPTAGGNAAWSQPYGKQYKWFSVNSESNCHMNQQLAILLLDIYPLSTHPKGCMHAVLIAALNTLKS